MNRKELPWIAGLAAGLVTVGVLAGLSRRRSAALMASAANRFLAALTPKQRAACTFGFEDEQRFDWHFLPRSRKGLPLKELDARQRQLAHDLLKTGLSQRGYLKATNVIALEAVLRALSGQAERDPELYYFTIFGIPSPNDPWGWRVEGHHLSLNYTVVNGKMVATTPAFFGADPAEVGRGPRQGLRVLGAEEDIARELLLSLDQQQRAVAIFDSEAPPDILTVATKTTDPLAPVGIQAGQLRQGQVSLLLRLLEEYAASMPASLAAERLEQVRRAGLEQVCFGWAGGIERGEGHYYRVQGPTFLIEYDNTQDNANHIHTVWRDFNGDFGIDLLREHYRDTPHKHYSRAQSS
ncbi:MAG: DUF3500 domain-containing protein [Kouleothrix sp.]|nr:DUF3500 domain-containing protein [Kouleothrix sp.]